MSRKAFAGEDLVSLHKLVWTALMAALVAGGAYLHIPLGPVPVSLQTMFVLLAGFLLGPLYGGAALLLYLAAGLIGLPVFSGGRSGLAHLMGPTGGYIIGFVLAAVVAGLAARGAGTPGWFRVLALGTAAMAAVYVPGLIQLKLVLDLTWAKTLAVGLLPFVPGAVAKILVAAAVFLYMRRKRLAP
jgi:biotin transport system substrate-specific component